ncbi:MAG: hypothetical protein AAFX06_28295 [Planctomycetota bacterium]
MLRDTAGQKLQVIAFNATGRVTGEAANITCTVRIDDGSRVAITDTNPAELGNGVYEFDLTQGETAGHELSFLPVCSTNGVEVLASPANVVYTDSIPTLVDDIVAQLAGNVIVTTLGPSFDAVDNRFDLIEGDDYTFENGRHVDFEFDPFGGTFADYSVEVGYESSEGTQVAGTVELIDDSGSSGKWIIRVEWTAAQLPDPGTYEWAARTSHPTNGNVTRIQGVLSVTNSPLEINT